MNTYTERKNQAVEELKEQIRIIGGKYKLPPIGFIQTYLKDFKKENTINGGVSDYFLDVISVLFLKE